MDSSWGLSAHTSMCLATGLVDKLGIDELKRIGYLKNDLSFHDSSRDMSEPDTYSSTSRLRAWDTGPSFVS
jgi:hypothetical protein